MPKKKERISFEELHAKGPRIRERLLDTAKNFRMSRHGNAELNEMEAEMCEEAARAIMIFGTEVTRLRLGIQHWHAGMLDRPMLYQMSLNWNYSAPDKEPPTP